MRSRVLPRITQLDAKKDAQEIVYLSVCFDFPFDTARALELALFRTFCSPRISALLDRTGEFRKQAQKRYDDTDILISLLVEHGYDSPEGNAAIERMNAIHSRFTINNEDYLYVLSTFVFEPIRWNLRFGWRRLCAVERMAWFHFWRELGTRMGMAAIPEDYAVFEHFNRHYERRYFVYHESNRRVGEATLQVFLKAFPRFLHPLIRQALCSLLDESARRAFGFSPLDFRVASSINWVLRARARLLRVMPRRRKAYRSSGARHPSYPAGFCMEELGPPWFIAQQ